MKKCCGCNAMMVIKSAPLGKFYYCPVCEKIEYDSIFKDKNIASEIFFIDRLYMLITTTRNIVNNYLKRKGDDDE